MNINGACEFYLGPMFSEKTTEVGRRLNRARVAKFNCVFIKYISDTRFGKGPVIYTHGGSMVKSSESNKLMGGLRVVEAKKLLDIKIEDDETDIGIDEGQFYPDLRQAIELWIKKGKRIYVAALDGDFRRIIFPPIADAIPLATQIIKLSAICMMCHDNESSPANAFYTIRTVESDEIELIGDHDKYNAVCLKCYNNYTRK